MVDGIMRALRAAGNDRCTCRMLAGTPDLGAHVSRASAAGDGLCGPRIGVCLQVRLIFGMHAREEVVRRGAAMCVCGAAMCICGAAAVPQADAQSRAAYMRQRCQQAGLQCPNVQGLLWSRVSLRSCCHVRLQRRRCSGPG